MLEKTFNSTGIKQYEKYEYNSSILHREIQEPVYFDAPSSSNLSLSPIN